MLRTILDHYQRATEVYIEAQELEKDDPKRALITGRYAGLKDLVTDIRALPEATTPKHSPQQRRQPRTLFGTMLGQRAKMVAEDVMDAMEAEDGGQ